MIDKEALKMLGDMLERGMERQLEGHYESIHGRIDDEDLASQKKASSGNDIEAPKENLKKTAGSSRPLQTGLGARRRNQDEQE